MADNLILWVARGDAGAEEVADLSLALRSELLDLDVNSVDPVTDSDVPESAKGIGAFTGALVVSLGAAERLRRVVGVLRDWTARNQRTVEVSFGSDALKLTGATTEQQDKIIEVWLARHCN